MVSTSVRLDGLNVRFDPPLLASSSEAWVHPLRLVSPGPGPAPPVSTLFFYSLFDLDIVFIAVHDIAVHDIVVHGIAKDLYIGDIPTESRPVSTPGVSSRRVQKNSTAGKFTSGRCDARALYIHSIHITGNTRVDVRIRTSLRAWSPRLDSDPKKSRHSNPCR